MSISDIVLVEFNRFYIFNVLISSMTKINKPYNIFDRIFFFLISVVYMEAFKFGKYFSVFSIL